MEKYTVGTSSLDCEWLDRGWRMMRVLCASDGKSGVVWNVNGKSWSWLGANIILDIENVMVCDDGDVTQYVENDNDMNTG